MEVDGQRYLVAPRGNTEWARNVRAAGGDAIIRRGKRQPVHLVELPVEQRAPIIQAYLKENAMVTKREFGIEPSAPPEDFQRIAPNTQSSESPQKISPGRALSRSVPTLRPAQPEVSKE